MFCLLLASINLLVVFLALNKEEVFHLLIFAFIHLMHTKIYECLYVFYKESNMDIKIL